jgi:hypothetical protein
MIIATTIAARLFGFFMGSGALAVWRWVGWLFCVGAVFGGGWYVESLRWEAADDKRIAEEAVKERDRQNAIRDAREDGAAQGYILAQTAEAERQKLEVSYADARTKLRTALQRPISCPAGGSLALGDVVVGSDTLVELRRAAGQDRIPAPEPPASEPQR